MVQGHLRCLSLALPLLLHFPRTEGSAIAANTDLKQRHRSPAIATNLSAPAVKISKMLRKGLADCCLVTDHLISNPKTTDAIEVTSPVRHLVEETRVGVSGRQPELPRALAPVHLNYEIHLHHLVLACLPLLGLLCRKRSQIFNCI